MSWDFLARVPTALELPKETVVDLKTARMRVFGHLHETPHDCSEDVTRGFLNLANTFVLLADQNVPWIVTKEEVDLAAKAADSFVAPYLPAWYEWETPLSPNQIQRFAEGSLNILALYESLRFQKTIERFRVLAQEAGCSDLFGEVGADSEGRANRLILRVASNPTLVLSGKMLVVSQQQAKVDLGDLSSQIYSELSSGEGNLPTAALISIPLLGDDLRIEAYSVDPEANTLLTLPPFEDAQIIEESLRRFFAGICQNNPSSSDEPGGNFSNDEEPEIIVCPPLPLEEIDCGEGPET